MIEMNCLTIIIGLPFFVYAGGVNEYNEKRYASEEYWNTCDFLKNNGYPCQTHQVTTKDGYILTLHRIPHGKKVNATDPEQGRVRPIAFLQHGIMQSSVDWVINGPNRSLGFLLADRGYDVWMGNSRGNKYSLGHIDFDPDSAKYWDFSFSEMASQDLPASINYILIETGEKDLYYIGHSQGSTIGFAGFSTSKTLARKIKLFIALAPIAHMQYAQGMLRVLSKFSPIVKMVLKLLGTKDFLPGSWITKVFARSICGSILIREVCESVLFLTAGIDTQNIDIERLPLYISHTPAGTSVKNIMHFTQLLESDVFRMYDYGWNGNMQRYLQPLPPRYFVGDMRVPVAMFTGSSDWLSTVQDVGLHLRHGLPNLVYFQENDVWNHLDFIWGKNAKETVYEKVFELLQWIPERKMVKT